MRCLCVTITCLIIFVVWWNENGKVDGSGIQSGLRRHQTKKNDNQGGKLLRRVAIIKCCGKWRCSRHRNKSRTTATQRVDITEVKSISTAGSDKSIGKLTTRKDDGPQSKSSSSSRLTSTAPEFESDQEFSLSETNGTAGLFSEGENDAEFAPVGGDSLFGEAEIPDNSDSDSLSSDGEVTYTSGKDDIVTTIVPKVSQLSNIDVTQKSFTTVNNLKSSTVVGNYGSSTVSPKIISVTATKMAVVTNGLSTVSPKIMSVTVTKMAAVTNMIPTVVTKSNMVVSTNIAAVTVANMAAVTVTKSNLAVVTDTKINMAVPTSTNMGALTDNKINMVPVAEINMAIVTDTKMVSLTSTKKTDLTDTKINMDVPTSAVDLMDNKMNIAAVMSTNMATDTKSNMAAVTDMVASKESLTQRAAMGEADQGTNINGVIKSTIISNSDARLVTQLGDQAPAAKGITEKLPLPDSSEKVVTASINPGGPPNGDQPLVNSQSIETISRQINTAEMSTISGVLINEGKIASSASQLPNSDTTGQSYAESKRKMIGDNSQMFSDTTEAQSTSGNAQRENINSIQDAAAPAAAPKAQILADNNAISGANSPSKENPLSNIETTLESISLSSITDTIINAFRDNAAVIDGGISGSSTIPPLVRVSGIDSSSTEISTSEINPPALPPMRAGNVISSEISSITSDSVPTTSESVPSSNVVSKTSELLTVPTEVSTVKAFISSEPTADTLVSTKTNQITSTSVSTSLLTTSSILSTTAASTSASTAMYTSPSTSQSSSKLEYTSTSTSLYTSLYSSPPTSLYTSPSTALYTSPSTSLYTSPPISSTTTSSIASSTLPTTSTSLSTTSSTSTSTTISTTSLTTSSKSPSTTSMDSTTPASTTKTSTATTTISSITQTSTVNSISRSSTSNILSSTEIPQRANCTCPPSCSCGSKLYTKLDMYGTFGSYNLSGDWSFLCGQYVGNNSTVTNDSSLYVMGTMAPGLARICCYSCMVFNSTRIKSCNILVDNASISNSNNSAGNSSTSFKFDMGTREGNCSIVPQSNYTLKVVNVSACADMPMDYGNGTQGDACPEIQSWQNSPQNFTKNNYNLQRGTNCSAERTDSSAFNYNCQVPCPTPCPTTCAPYVCIRNESYFNATTGKLTAAAKAFPNWWEGPACNLAFHAPYGPSTTNLTKIREFCCAFGMTPVEIEDTAKLNCVRANMGGPWNSLLWVNALGDLRSGPGVKPYRWCDKNMPVQGTSDPIWLPSGLPSADPNFPYLCATSNSSRYMTITQKNLTQAATPFCEGPLSIFK